MLVGNGTPRINYCMTRNQETAHRHAYPKEQSPVFKTLNATGKIKCKQTPCTWATLR